MAVLRISLVLMMLPIVRCDGNHDNGKIHFAAKSVDVHRINCTAESIEDPLCIHATWVSTGKPVDLAKQCSHFKTVEFLEDGVLTKLSARLPNVTSKRALLFYFLIPKVPRVLQDSLAEFNCTFTYPSGIILRRAQVSRIPMIDLTCCAHSDDDDSKQCDDVATTNSSEYSGIGTCTVTGEFNSIDIWPKPLLYEGTKPKGQTAWASAIDPNPSESKTYECVATSKHVCSKKLTYRAGRTPPPVSGAETHQAERENVTPTRQKECTYTVVSIIISSLVAVGVGVGVTLGVIYFRRNRRMAGRQNHVNEAGEGDVDTPLR